MRLNGIAISSQLAQAQLQQRVISDLRHSQRAPARELRWLRAQITRIGDRR